MANTYTLIASSTVGSGGASSIEFTSIPATYTDLLVKYSVRLTAADQDIHLRLNGSSSSIYSGKLLYGNGSAAASLSWSASDNDNFHLADSSAYTASTFSSGEIYIPNYTGSENKSYSSDSVNENNATTARAQLNAGLFASTSAISSIKFYYSGTSNDIVQYSTAYLYGIKNS